MLKKEIIANVFMIVLGTLMHFAYQLSNQNPIVGMFVPINESVWEHLKLLFFPGLFYFLGETFFQKEKYLINGLLLFSHNLRFNLYSNFLLHLIRNYGKHF